MNMFTEFFIEPINGFYLLEIDNGVSISIIKLLLVQEEDENFIYTLSLDNKERLIRCCYPKKRIISIKQKHI